MYIASIIFLWGVSASLFALMRTPSQFYVLRLLLGCAEAGAFPGMWFFLSKFYPTDHLTLPYTIVDSGISLSHVIAAPLAAACLSLTGLGGLRGWQWLFFLEGLPTLLLAGVMLMMLPNSPEEASFLLPRERAFIAARVAGRKPASVGGAGMVPKPATSGSSGGVPRIGSVSNVIGSGVSGSLVSDLVAAFSNKFVWYLGVAKFFRDIAGFGISK